MMNIQSKHVNKILKNVICKRLADLGCRRVLIYGTKMVAGEVIDLVSEIEIVGILDQYRVKGYMKGYPILTWDDVSIGDADALIIASNMRHYESIYKRIMYKCFARKLMVLSADGQCLSERYFLRDFIGEEVDDYENNADRICKTIDQYDAISFDLFDTLVMRKTLEADDILDIVSYRLQNKDIQILDFKNTRIEAEINLCNADIYEIYNYMHTNYGISQEMCDIALEEEIACEKEMIIPRSTMINLLKYSLSIKKRVSIITDIHIPKKILEEILQENDIGGYFGLYVSCNRKKSKREGLFEIYKQEVKSDSYLHIGDNKESDYESAIASGIDSIRVMSAIEMFKHSGFRQALTYELGINDRIVLGYIISKIFNNPFLEIDKYGNIDTTGDDEIGLVCFAPLLITYMYELSKEIKNNQYDGIMYGSRDCYLIYKLVQGKNYYNLRNSVENHYLYISRRLAIKLGITDSQDMDWFKGFYGSEQADNDALKSIFTIGHDDKVNRDGDIDKKEIFFESQKTKQNYLMYLTKNGVDINKKYLFCELLAQGTIQSRLNKIFNKKVTGFYIHRDFNKRSENLEYASIYPAGEFCYDGNTVHYLEWVMTSLEPGTHDIDKNGNVIYENDIRSSDEIERVDSLHHIIGNHIDNIYNLLIFEKHINANLSRSLYQSIPFLKPNEDNIGIDRYILRDEINHKNY